MRNYGKVLLRPAKGFFSKAIVAGAVMLLGPGGLWAWGMVGHETVALIAEDHLTKAARLGVQEILGPRQSLADVSTWADSIVDRRPETRPWHYLNLDAREDQNQFDLTDSCRNHDCVVDQIDRDQDVLREPFASKRDKQEALKFLVHFVGDLHQPLHCVDDHDRGGNEKWFRYHGAKGTSSRYTWVNFHSFWDNLLEPHAKEKPLGFASRLENEISSEDEKTWAKGKASDWAYESFLIARNDIYKDLPEGKLLERDWWGKDLPEDYYSAKMRLIVDRQLEKAGIRLAYLLNGLFEKH